MRTAILPVLAALAALAWLPGARAEQVAQGVEKLEYRGWKECYRLSNGDTEVIIAPAVGARVVRFAYKGKNVLWEDKNLNGTAMKTGDHDEQNRYWLPWDGSQPDMFDEKGFRQFYPIWMGAYKATSTGPFTVTTENEALEPRQGDAACVKTFTLDPKRPRLTFGYRVINKGNETRTWSLVQRTMLAAPGFLLLPLKRKSAFEGGWKLISDDGAPAMDPTTQTGQRTMERLKESVIVGSRDCVAVAPQMLGPKSRTYMLQNLTVVTDSDAAWMAWVADNLAFVMQYPYSASGKHRTENVVTQNYFAEDRLEMSPYAATRTVKPGEWASLDTVWTFVPLRRAPKEARDAGTARGEIERAIRR